MDQNLNKRKISRNKDADDIASSSGNKIPRPLYKVISVEQPATTPSEGELTGVKLGETWAQASTSATIDTAKEVFDNTTIEDYKKKTIFKHQTIEDYKKKEKKG